MSELYNMNTQYDMVIKKSFAKYVIDNKAKLVERNAPVSEKERNKSIFAPALTCTIENTDHLLEERIKITSVHQNGEVPFVKIGTNIVQNNRIIKFMVIFDVSLVKFLPNKPDDYKQLFVSFASTTSDSFLFLQFAKTRLQIRALLVSKEEDIPRIFKETSFFAIPYPVPQSFAKAKFMVTYAALPKKLIPTVMPKQEQVAKQMSKVTLAERNTTDKEMEFEEDPLALPEPSITSKPNIKEELDPLALSVPTPSTKEKVSLTQEAAPVKKEKTIPKVLPSETAAPVKMEKPPPVVLPATDIATLKTVKPNPKDLPSHIAPFSVEKPEPEIVPMETVPVKIEKLIPKIVPIPKLTISYFNSLKKIRYSKEDYLSSEVILDDKSYDVYYHDTNQASIKKVIEKKIADCENLDNGFIVNTLDGEKIQLKEIVSNHEDIPRLILTCSSFLIHKSNMDFLKEQKLKIEEIAAEPLKAVVKCPFPMCKEEIVAETNVSIIDHFLKHLDFKRVIEGQIKRHQEKKAKQTHCCPFDKCFFQSQNRQGMEKHYAGLHKVGHIVFIQFSKANKWSMETFLEQGVILDNVLNLVQCSHCYEVMTRPQLALHIQHIKAAQQAQLR